MFYKAVHQGAGGAYSTEECAAWAPSETPPAGWEARVLAGHCLVAQDRSGVIVGFMTLGDDGFLDFAYVAPDWMGRGVAAALYEAIEATARARGIPLLSTEASHLARAFLARRGWQVEARQSVIRNRVALTNFRMNKVF
ncbi:GNAT family N-acetyltransferase [Actibacterium sp. XHP0104]|uniref:GNAT family N-acetyltransferase n=1 Tax=Actibacterium sp. XHP0104 TaxID=2984335 RepID=UPI0021E9586A|nr:GNAT family N-acetyltransferase [Actibacterium sp. XHP0104]MCV2881363.1 GNAT family N-acetyltransferase [Actibacterium sp. XHP0104]